MAWTLVARKSDCADNILDFTLNIGANSLLITSRVTPTHIYNFYLSGETLHEIPIQLYTSYGQAPYRPGYFVFHAGNLYGYKILDISALYGGAETDIAQVFSINPNAGTLVLELDTWEPIGFEKVYINCARDCWDIADCPVNFPDFPTEDELAAGRRSGINGMLLDSYAGELHAVFHRVTQPIVWYENLCWPLPPHACVYHDNNKWADAILIGGGGGNWKSGYKLALGDVPYGTAFFPSPPVVVHHETQAVAIFERAGGNLDVMYYQPDGWERLVTNEPTIVYPDGGFGQLFWKVDGNDLKWTGSDLRAAAWQLYFTYPDIPHLPPCGWAVDLNKKPIIAVPRLGPGVVEVYYGKVKTATDIPTPTANGSLMAIGCITFSGDYVAVSYREAAGNHVLEIWKREPCALSLGVAPLGMDIDTGDGYLYITGESYLPSGVLGSGFDSLIHLNLLWSVDTITMSSAMQYWTSVSGGWLYPHAGSWSQLYLYGYAGPDCKAVMINDMPEWGGWPATVILQPTTAGYIGGLHASPFFDGDDIHFAVVTASGWLGSSSNAGTTYKKELDLPYPVGVVYRNIMSDSAGSGYATWIGAKGSYACPIKVTVDLNAWGNRCANLPAVTVTDIDSFD